MLRELFQHCDTMTLTKRSNRVLRFVFQTYDTAKFPSIVPQNRWFVMEHPIKCCKMDNLGASPEGIPRKPPYLGSLKNPASFRSTLPPSFRFSTQAQMGDEAVGTGHLNPEIIRWQRQQRPLGSTAAHDIMESSKKQQQMGKAHPEICVCV